MNSEIILQCFSGVLKGTNGQYQAKCPCHDDRKASLSIKILTDKALLHCKAGCKTEDILQRIGLTFADLGEPRAKPTYKDKIINAYSREYGSIELVAEYPYYDELGNYLYSKIRLEKGKIDGKLIRYWVIDKQNDTARACKGEYDRKTKPLYRLNELKKAISNGYKQVFITEGEKDTHTLINLDKRYSATVTPGGCEDWKKDFAKYFKGCFVTIFADNDEPGIKFAEQIKRDLKNFAFCVRVVTPSNIKKGDITDYLTVEHGTKESLESVLNNTPYEPGNYVNATDKALTINNGLLAELIARQEPILINRVGDKDNLYLYSNGYYKKQNKTEAKSLIAEYIPTDKRSDNQLNNIYNLLLTNLNNDIDAEELNADERYINLKNGLYSIADQELKKHTPKTIYTKQINVNYRPGSLGKHFEKYIKDFCSDDNNNFNESKAKVLQEYMGLIVSNIPIYKIKKALFLVSEQGNTGKSVFIKLFSEILGAKDNVISINLAELIPENRFVLGMIDQTRLIVCGDESYTDIKDSSIFKRLTGGDLVKIEKKGQCQEYATYKGGIIVACNGMPCFADDKGEHLFKRLLIVPCNHHINESNIDNNLIDKLLKEKEYILQWALKGLARLLDNNFAFTECEEITSKTEEYRSKLDTLYHFISENYIITGNYKDLIKKTDFDNDYRQWANDNGYENIVRPRNITNRLESIGVRMSKGKYQGENTYRYIGIKEKDCQEIDCQDIPFE